MKIAVAGTGYTEDTLFYRAYLKHFLLDTIKFKSSKLYRAINYGLAKIQQPFASRKYKDCKAYCTSALFSITSEFAKYLARNRNMIAKRFKYSYVGEEIWIGTVFKESPFSNKLGREDDARYIDWVRKEGSSPRTFDISDKKILENVINDDRYMFARKFSQDRNIEIVRFVEQLVSLNKN